MEPIGETPQANTQLDRIQARLAKLSSEGESNKDAYQSKEKMDQAKSFFGAMGLTIDTDGLISQDLTPEQIDALARWRKETMSGSIEMPDEDMFYRKTLLAVSLWRQSEGTSTNYLLGKGIGAEVTIRGQVKGRVKRPSHFSYRSHSDFELYGVDYEHDERGENTSGKLVYPDNFKTVFGGQEFFPPTKTKGLREVPPELLHETAETVDLGGVEVLVPELELQFLDKWEASGSYHRPEGTDAEVLARQYDLDHEKIHDYLDRFVIQPEIATAQGRPRNNPEWHLDRVARQIAFTREQLIEGGTAEPSLDQVLTRLNADMQRQIQVHSIGDAMIGGVRLSLWKDLKPDQIGEGDQIVDPELIRQIEVQMQKDKQETIARFHQKHGELDELFLKIAVDQAIEERRIPSTIDSLPPVQEGCVRIVHTTNPRSIIPIMETGLDYEKFGMIDSTVRPVEPDVAESYYVSDPRFNYPTVRTIIFDLPASELTTHRRFGSNPGVLPSKYIVGIIDGYKPTPPTAELKAAEQSPIQKTSQKLIETLYNAPNHPDETDLDGLITARQELEFTFSHFPELIPAFTSLYREELNKLGFDPGEIRLYMVGGRIREKPLRESSDIDIIFTFEKPLFPYDKRDTSGVSPDRWRAARKKLLFNDYPRLCQQLGIQNNGDYPGRFQFLGWGENGFEEFEEKEKTNAALLIFSDKPAITPS